MALTGQSLNSLGIEKTDSAVISLSLSVVYQKDSSSSDKHQDGWDRSKRVRGCDRDREHIDQLRRSILPFTRLGRRLRMRKVKWTGRVNTPGAYLYRINVRYRSECIRNTGECYGDKVGMERRMEGIGHRRKLTEQRLSSGRTYKQRTRRAAVAAAAVATESTERW